MSPPIPFPTDRLRRPGPQQIQGQGQAQGQPPAPEMSEADVLANWTGPGTAELAQQAPAARAQGPSDWLSFNEYMGIASPELRARIEASQADANRYGEEAQADLMRAGWDEQTSHSGSLAGTASYGEFLKAKSAGQAAANSWRSNSANPYISALEGMYAPSAQGPDFQGMYAKASNEAMDERSNYLKRQQAAQADAQKREAQRQAEQARQDQFFQQNYGMTQAEWQASRQGSPSQQSYPGGQTYEQYNTALGEGYKHPIY